MSNEIKQKSEYFSALINTNYNQLKEFYSHSFMEFCELNKLKDEILNCQLFELFQASIFSTNHFMERMIKLALIKLHTIDYDYSDIENYTEKLKESESEYDGLTLYQSLKKAFEKELISTEQHDYMINVKNEFRNPYSHAEVSKIIKNNNDFTGFMINIHDDQNKLKEENPLDKYSPIVIPKFSPAIAQFLQENNSREKAFEFFKKIFGILKELEFKITELKSKKH